MDTGEDQAIVPIDVDEQHWQEGHGKVGSGNASAIHHHYHAPVSHVNVGQAYSPNFGANYGNMNQTMYQSASPVHWGGMATGGPSQPIGGADVFSLLNPILDASHTRNMKRSPPNSQCLPGTRKKVIEDICTWANSDLLDTNPHMLWVLGYAGCGKSAIAHEIAKIFADQNRLAACFVFFRGSGDRSSVARFATTVASQVAAAIPETESIIDSAVRRNRGLLTNASTSLSEQFKHLIYLPILAIASQRSAPFIVVLDGVDECKDHDDIATLIQDSIDFFTVHPHTPLRFLIASRVEDHLHQVLHSSNQVHLLNLVECTSDADIAAALDAAIEKEQRGQVLSRNELWPSAEDREKLVKHIDGSFIFMTTILRRLFDRNIRDGLTPMERLPLVLSMKANFDDLYTEILAPWQELPHFSAVISIIVLARRSLTIVELAYILCIKTAHVVNVLINVHAIIQVPGDDHTPITLLHTSLRDFLCSQDRSGTLFANPASHRQLAYCDMRNSDSPLGAPLSQYAQQFALDHLGNFLGTLDDSPSSTKSEQISVIDLLNGPIFEDGQTALEAACHAGKWMVARALVNANVEVNVRFQEFPVGPICALHSACFGEQLDLIYLLLEKGADPNIISPNKDAGRFNDGTALAFAAWKADINLVTQLLTCGADPNLQGGYFNTSLQAACTAGSLEVINFLLNNGADPNLRGGAFGSALHACACRGYDSCAARALLQHKADPNIQDEDDTTPLHEACYWGNIKVVECLLEYKVDASMKNNENQTALQTAQYRGKQDVVELFLQHGIVA